MQAKTLLEDQGITLTSGKLTTPLGEFAVKDIQSVDQRVSKPMWGPLFLAVLGTINLGRAMDSGFWPHWLVAIVCLGSGLFWWMRGSKYVLTLKTQDGKEVDAWYSRSQAPVTRAVAMIKDVQAKRAAQED